MLIGMTELAILSYKIEMVGSVFVFDDGVAVKTIGFIWHVFLMHEIAITRRGGECLAPVMTGKATVGDDVSSLNFTTAFDHLKMATLTGNPRFLNRLVGNRFFGACRVVSF